MVVGDVVSGISPVNTTWDFQPAAGVEVMVSSISLTNQAFGNLAIYDGTKASPFQNGTDNGLMTKIFINNTNYLRFYALGAGNYASYTGLQIK